MTKTLAARSVLLLTLALGLFAEACNCGHETAIATLKKNGEACDDDTQCESALCDVLKGAPKVCLQPCANGCAETEICTTIGFANNQPRQTCVQDLGGLCQACTTSADCPWAADSCLVIDGKNVCARDCSFDGKCPDGFVCADGKDASGLPVTKQCQPKSGTCDCTPSSAGQTRSCKVANTYGTCAGMETCDPQKGFVGCNAKVPQQELCNLEDDNCDGQVDEDSDHSKNPAAGIAPLTCGKGACFRSVPGCVDGKVQMCVEGTPAQEICNGLDDDCNGTVDDPFTDLGMPCANGVGACKQTGKMVCLADGSGTACGAVPLPPQNESCNGMDDDCNGSVDDLGTTSCGIGVCKNTILVCQNAQVQTCTPNNQNKTTESCNTLDDDCDGVIDNGFDLQTDLSNCGKCGVACNVRNGTPDCVKGACLIKSCNVSQGFDDCDKDYTTGCETDIWSTLDHCGGCGKKCAFANATARCASGSCSMGPCLAGFYDANNDPADGCEYACTFKSATDLPDDTLEDSNCDGVDGEVANAVFVDCGAGVDSNTGTKDKPVKTIGRALQLATGTRVQVLVAGTCSESVTLKDGVGLYGGYGAAWKRSLATPSTISPLVGGTPAITGANIASTTRIDAFILTSSAGASSSSSSITVQLTAASAVQISNCDIRAGSGANGTDGSGGQTGAQGGNGGPGGPGGDGTSAGGARGTGGTSSCAAGGAGGLGGFDTGNGEAGRPGSAGACGGTLGAGGICSSGSGCGGQLGGSVGGAGCTGGTGPSGSNGGGGNNAGSVLGATFTPSRGGDGTDGGAGGSGGGGGGGGGGGARYCVNFLGCNCTNTCNSDRGGGGGGGGGAGCGGTRGLGGFGGGASIGLLLVGSSPSIRDTKITTSRGGNGGKGGVGGDGGPGGLGNSGGSNADDAGGGGKGGDGGKGGRAGSGGGGGGGPSVGIYKASGAAPTLTGVTFSIGSGGTGGLGGAGTNNGANGVSAQTFP